MDNPKFTWFIQNEEDNFIASNSYTAEGSYVPGDYLIKNIQIWNNYNGNEDIEDAENVHVVFSFKTYEDNFLLNLIEVSVEDEEYKKINIDINRGFIYIGKLTGNSNIGNVNSSNCKNIKIKIGPIPENIKTDLKTLIFYIDNNIKQNSITGNNIITYDNDSSTPDNIISAVDKYYVNLRDEIILNNAINYIDQKIKSLIDSAPSDLDTLSEISKALDNNPEFAKDQTVKRQKIENKLNEIENLTLGFESPIKDYIDQLNPDILEKISIKEIEELITKIKNNLNL